MAQKVNQKCLECSKVSFRISYNRDPCKKPKCYKDACQKKRSYYRKLEHYRLKQISYHRYRKFQASKCLICSKTDNLEVHHIVPQSLGGGDTEFNLVTLCSDCHKIVGTYYSRLGWERKPYGDSPKTLVNASILQEVSQNIDTCCLV